MPFTPNESAVQEEMIDLGAEQNLELLPSTTWEFDFNKGEFTGRKITGVPAYSQAIQKALLTERDRYMIYDDSYGSELHLIISDKTGSKAYKESEAMAMAEETVVYDDRTESIENITVSSNEDEMRLNILIVPNGRLSMEPISLEVNIND